MLPSTTFCRHEKMMLAYLRFRARRKSESVG